MFERGITWKDVNGTQIWMIIVHKDGLYHFEKWNTLHPEHKTLLKTFKTLAPAINYMRKFVLGYY